VRLHESTGGARPCDGGLICCADKETIEGLRGNQGCIIVGAVGTARLELIRSSLHRFFPRAIATFRPAIGDG
jgi:hypothetical protein